MVVFYEISGWGSCPVVITLFSDIAPVSSKEFFDIQAVTECRFTLNSYVI